MGHGDDKNVSPFLRCEVAASDFNLDFRDALRNGTSTLFLKGKRILEQRKGFTTDANGNRPYLGDPNHLYVRYRYEFGQLFKAGITMEKDPENNCLAGQANMVLIFIPSFCTPEILIKRSA